MATSSAKITVELDGRRETFGSIEELHAACQKHWRLWLAPEPTLARGSYDAARLHRIQKDARWLEAMAAAGEAHIIAQQEALATATQELEEVLRQDPFGEASSDVP